MVVVILGVRSRDDYGGEMAGANEEISCGGRFRPIALIDEAAVIQRILNHLHLPTDVPAPRSGRAPPLLNAGPSNQNTDIAVFSAYA
jgi:hypothetical protein